MENILDLGNLQFYWRMTSQVDDPKNVVPDFLPFSLIYDQKNRLIKQKSNSLIWESLERVYQENYNVGYLQEGHDLAEAYGNDFLNIILDAVKKFNPSAKEVREIGAGGCYILKRIIEHGFEGSAIDPSPVCVDKGKAFGINVFAEFYPTKEKLPAADVYIHYDVLEHIEDPVLFLQNHFDELNENGLIVFAVPDCSSYIQNGDISMIIHEHINFYDVESLGIVAARAGFHVLNIEKAKYGGVLYCVAQKKNTKPLIYIQQDDHDCDQKFIQYVEQHKKLIQIIKEFIEDSFAQRKSIGFYIPLRSIPYLSMLGIKKNIRFFDDDRGVHRKYFDGFPVAVENFEDLKINPVDHMIILSCAFGDKIKEKIKNNFGDTIHVVTIKDLAKFYN